MTTATETKAKDETKTKEEQKRQAYLKAQNKASENRRRLIALCWTHAETRKQFSQGEDEWTPQDQLISNLLHDLESSIDELIHDTSAHLDIKDKKFKDLCTCRNHD